MSTGKLSAAFVGLGAVVRNIHVPAYRALAHEVSMIAGCDPDPQARAFAREKLGVPVVFDSAEDMLRSVQPDIAVVCTPPAVHCQSTLLALEHGCHVFCEKPFANSLDEAEQMVRAGDLASRLIVVNNQFPYMKIHMAAKAAIGTPEFGELLHLHVSHRMRPVLHHQSAWRDTGRKRLCFEFGIHVLDLARHLFGAEPTRLFAHMPRSGSVEHGDTLNTIALEFLGGKSASIVLDRLSKGPERYLDMRLDGECATIETSIGGQAIVTLGVRTRERRPFAGFRYVLGGCAVLQNGNKERVIAKDPMNPFAAATRDHFRQFLRCLRSGERPPGDGRDNRKSLTLALAAYQSADNGCWINVHPQQAANAGAYAS